MTTFFVCATPGEGRCGGKGGGELYEAFRAEVGRRGLPPSAVLRNACTRRHHEGPVVFVYPDDVWYTRVTPGDVAGIVEQHLAPVSDRDLGRRTSGRPPVYHAESHAP